jgi:acyl-homoserine lactone acylase PvdQ
MDFLRRLGQGRLAEVLGNDPEGATLLGDVLNRTLGLARTAREHFVNAPPKARMVLQSCSTGIN